MRRVFIAWLLLLPGLQAFSQFVSVPLSARSSAMGGCVIHMEQERYVMLGYRSGYAVSGMGTARLDVALPIGERGRFHAGYSHFGDADYAEHRLSASYAMRVTEWMETGVDADYCVQAVGDAHYDTRRWLSPSAFVCFSLSPRLRLMALGGTRPWDGTRPWRMHLGMAYRPVSRLLTLLEVESEEQWRLRLGAEYCYRQHFYFRAGLATSPLVVTAGLGVYYGRYLVDISVESHPVLGLSPQIGIALCF